MASIPGLWKRVVLFSNMPAREVAWMCAAPMGMPLVGGRQPCEDVLAAWAEGLAGRGARVLGRGCLRFAFYGRVSTEDWQDPVSSRARQLQQAVMLVAGHGVIAAVFFDAGESRVLPWARRPQAAALVAQLADPDRGLATAASFGSGPYFVMITGPGQLTRSTRLLLD
jgi:hypothetical protein